MKKSVAYILFFIAVFSANAQYIKVNREVICPGEYAALSTDTMVNAVNIGDIICYKNAGDTIIVTASDWSNTFHNTHTALSVVFFVDSTGQHGWAAGLISQSQFYIGDAEYDENIYVNFPNYFSTPHDAIRDINGRTNTDSIRNGPNFSTAYNPAIPSPPFYLPALGQLNYFYTQYVTLESIYSSVWGVSLPAIQTNNRFWTSTGHWNSEEYDDVWCLLLPFNPDIVDGSDYDVSYYVLPVMNF